MEIMEKVLIETINKEVELPTTATAGSAGIDFKANNFKQVYTIENSKLSDTYIGNRTTIMLKPGERLLVGTGVKMAIPEGYQLDIRPRSGNALKYGLTVLNSPGTIDSDYRGEIGVILINTSGVNLPVSIGDKVAQGVFLKYEMPNYEIVSTLEETERGEGGFGSTGN